MDTSKLKIGLSAHFPRHHWLKETQYLEVCVKVAEKDLQIHDEPVSSAFQNIIAFLKSINKTGRTQSARIYDSILKDDPYNLNALFGLHEITVSTNKRKDYERKVEEIMRSDIQKKALPKALLEIGLAFCLLIPRYHFKNETSDSSFNEANDGINIDGYENLEFKTEELPMGVDLYTDTNIAQKKRVYNSLRYLKEGMVRLDEIKTEQDKTDETVWKFFLSMAYNRLDNWIAHTHGSKELRKQLSLKSLELFCEIAAASDPNSGDKHSRMYFQRCLAYIGQILFSRKDVLMCCEDDNYVPECFLKYEGHFIGQLWKDPKQSFLRALEYGYDPTVYTRYAKSLLHEKEYDSAIEKINEVFTNGDSNWYSACIRMAAYKQKHMESYKAAKRNGDFSSLTKDELLKAEKDGYYCFNTFATAKDQSKYATILRWLGTFPNGRDVTDEDKIQSALIVLDRVYEEQGCHTHFEIHKTRAECHKDTGDFDEAIKYAIWSLNSTPDSLETFPLSFSFLVDLLFAKINQEPAMQDAEKRSLLRTIRHYIKSEINRRCHQLIKQRFQAMQLNDERLDRVCLLLRIYDEGILKEIKTIVSSESFSDEQQKDNVFKLCKNYDVLFSIVKKWCRCYPDEVKSLLDLTSDIADIGSLQTFVTMCLKCLGREHKEWTQEYNRKWEKMTQATRLHKLDLFSSTLEEYPEKGSFDFLIIHAPEDKDWVFYTFLQEMEQRPIKFEGCVPDRDFKKGDTFAQNVVNCLAKTCKVLLVLTANFFERIYECIANGDDRGILQKLETMHTDRHIDVITLFLDVATLNLEKYAVLMKFYNVDTSTYGFEWNYLRKLLLRSTRTLSTTRDAEDDDDEYKEIAQEILPYGVPKAVYILYHPAFVIGYDGEKKVPRWVAHRIDSKVKRGIVSRKTHHKQLRTYRPDLTIPEQARSSQKDYKTREYLTIGHMTPLADHSSSLKLAKDTNIMTNMVPEVKNNCLWNRLEEYCRDSLTTDFETIYVMSGTLFLPVKTEDGREIVQYEVIGRNKVAVPTDLFKIIIAKQSEEKPKVGAFKVPNKPLYDAELIDLTVSISWLEGEQGIDLFRDLGKDVKDSKTTTLTTAFFSKKDRVRKMIRDVSSLNGLDSVWKKLTSEDKSELQSDYDEKKERLENKTKQTE